MKKNKTNTLPHSFCKKMQVTISFGFSYTTRTDTIRTLTKKQWTNSVTFFFLPQPFIDCTADFVALETFLAEFHQNTELHQLSGQVRKQRCALSLSLSPCASSKSMFVCRIPYLTFSFWNNWGGWRNILFFRRDVHNPPTLTRSTLYITYMFYGL